MNHWPDVVNGSFEAGGAVAVWMNVAKLSKDREVKGVVWQFSVFWWVWGLWNLLYYPLLGQWLSTVSTVAICLGNMMWVVLWLKIRKGSA